MTGVTMKGTATQVVVSLYRTLFARERLYMLNRFLLSLALRGMGILNFEGGRVTGEDSFLLHTLSRFVAGEHELIVFDVGANEGCYLLPGVFDGGFGFPAVGMGS